MNFTGVFELPRFAQFDYNRHYKKKSRRYESTQTNCRGHKGGEGKEYSDDELCDIEDKIGDMVMDHAIGLDDMPDSKRDFWESLIDTFVTLQDDE